MPNLAAAKKSLRADARKQVYNLRRSRVMKEVIKEISDLVKSDKVAAAQKLLPTAYKAIDKAVKRGVIKANTAARKKSQLARLLAQASKK